MVPITIVFMGFINQLITFGGPTLHLEEETQHIQLPIHCRPGNTAFRLDVLQILGSHEQVLVPRCGRSVV